MRRPRALPRAIPAKAPPRLRRNESLARLRDPEKSGSAPRAAGIPSPAWNRRCPACPGGHADCARPASSAPMMPGTGRGPGATRARPQCRRQQRYRRCRPGPRVQKYTSLSPSRRPARRRRTPCTLVPFRALPHPRCDAKRRATNSGCTFPRSLTLKLKQFNVASCLQLNQRW